MTSMEELRKVAEAATPGPWEKGDRQHVAGVIHGDRCGWCGREDARLVWSGYRKINGTVMRAHVHENTQPWWPNGIFAHRVDGSLSVIADTDEYGLMAREDSTFIATFNPHTVLGMLDEIERLRAAVAEYCTCPNPRDPDGCYCPLPHDDCPGSHEKES